MTYRFHGSGSSESARPVSRARSAAVAVEHAARAIRVREGGETVIGAMKLIDALDHYWQVRYGGRVIVVAGPEEAER